MRDDTHVTDICGLVHKLTDLILKAQNVCQWRLIAWSMIDFLLTYCEVTMEWYSSIRTMSRKCKIKAYTILSTVLLFQVWKFCKKVLAGRISHFSLLKRRLKFHLIDPLRLGQVRTDSGTSQPEPSHIKIIQMTLKKGILLLKNIRKMLKNTQCCWRFPVRAIRQVQDSGTT